MPQNGFISFNVIAVVVVLGLKFAVFTISITLFNVRNIYLSVVLLLYTNGNWLSNIVSVKQK